MKPQSQPTTQEVLAGPVERVTFHNDESGFCVLRIKARGHRELVTVIGHAAVISAGEWITASGEWINDRTHGQQFKAKFLKTSEPTSLDGIEKYLGSGMIRGIGPVYAKKLVRAFGEKVFDTIEAEPERLREVTGIGAVRANRITAAWADQKIIREIMVFLHSNGVGTARAVRIFKTYGADAVQVMSLRVGDIDGEVRREGANSRPQHATIDGVQSFHEDAVSAEQEAFGATLRQAQLCIKIAGFDFTCVEVLEAPPCPMAPAAIPVDTRPEKQRQVPEIPACKRIAKLSDARELFVVDEWPPARTLELADIERVRFPPVTGSHDVRPPEPPSRRSFGCRCRPSRGNGWSPCSCSGA
jgi:hypothetical protein